MNLWNGTEIANYSLDEEVSGRIVSAGDSYYLTIGSSPWLLLAFNPDDINGFIETWSTLLRSEPMGEGSIAGSHMYITQRNGEVISIGASNSKPMAIIDSPGEGGLLFGGENILLDASSSYDPNGDSISFSWKIEGESKILYRGTEPKKAVNISGVGDVKLILTVYDDMMASSSTYVNLTLLKRVHEIHPIDQFETSVEISFGISEPNGKGFINFIQSEDFLSQTGIVQALQINFTPIPRYATYLHDWANISMGYLTKELTTHREKLAIYKLDGGEWVMAEATGSNTDEGYAWGNFSSFENGIYALGIIENRPPFLRHIQNADYLYRSGNAPEYTFIVGYRDPDSDPPEFVRLILDKEEYPLTPSGFLPNLTGYNFYKAEKIPLKPGQHSYYFQADDGYFTVTTDEYQFGVENTEPVVDVIAPSSPVLVNRVLLFDASGSYDPDGDELFFKWDFDKSNGIEREKVGSKVDHTYEKEGVYTITVTVSDGTKDVVEEITITVIEEEEDEGSQWYLAAILLVSFILILLVAVVIVFNLSRNTAKEREDLTRGLQDKPWTCPECGKKVYPGVSECPDCGYEYDPLDFEDEPGGITIGSGDTSDIFEDLEEIEE